MVSYWFSLKSQVVFLTRLKLWCQSINCRWISLITETSKTSIRILAKIILLSRGFFKENYLITKSLFNLLSKSKKQIFFLTLALLNNIFTIFPLSSTIFNFIIPPRTFYFLKKRTTPDAFFKIFNFFFFIKRIL